MIPVSNDYRHQLIQGNRNYLIKVNMTLADGTTLLLENRDIWDNGITIDEATSDDSTFNIGSAIVGSLKVVIDNINGNYSAYDFYDAHLVLYLGVEGDVDEYSTQRYYRIGFYVVDEPNYNGSLITLNCLNNMTWFDVPFENISITYPTTAGYVVSEICSHVGVTLGTVTFPNYNTAISVEIDSKLNCREIIQYIAQMCCCYCKINTAGELVLAWYDKNEIIGITDYDGGTYNTTTTPYSDGCDLDGGHFNPWDGDNADGGLFSDLLNGAWLTQNFEMNVSTDDVVVTGCRVRNTTSNDDSYDEIWVDPVVEQDHVRYVLVIENNPFITSTNAAAIANVVGSTLAGLPIRGYSATSLSDFSYQTGDMVRIIDFRGNRYYSWITHFTFTTNNSERFSCGVESLRKRSEERYSQNIKTLAEANENASAALTEYDTAVKAMNELAQDAIGYYKYEHTVTGSGNVTWLHNGATEDLTDPENPLFPNSTVVFKVTGDGVFLSNDGGTTYTQGYDANSGTAILSLIYAVGISCDWIHAGTLTLGGYNNQNGWLKILNSSGSQIGYWDNSGIHASNGTFTGTVSGSTINGSTLFTMTANNADYTHNSTLNWGGTWQDSLTVVIDRNDDAGVGVAKASDPSRYGCYMHYDDIRLYDGHTSSWYEPDWSPHSSDARLKENIEDLDGKTLEEFFLKLRPVRFDFKDWITNQVGVVAQDLIEVAEELGIDESKYISTDENGYYKVDYARLKTLSMLATHDLYERVNKQQEEIDLLKQELAELKARIK